MRRERWRMEQQTLLDGNFFVLQAGNHHQGKQNIHKHLWLIQVWKMICLHSCEILLMKGHPPTAGEVRDVVLLEMLYRGRPRYFRPTATQICPHRPLAISCMSPPVYQHQLTSLRTFLMNRY